MWDVRRPLGNGIAFAPALAADALYIRGGTTRLVPRREHQPSPGEGTVALEPARYVVIVNVNHLGRAHGKCVAEEEGEEGSR